MDLPKLNCDVEEANTSIIPHLNKISLNKSAFAVVLSVTQIYVLLLRYRYMFQNNGLSKLWMRNGKENAQQIRNKRQSFKSMSNYFQSFGEKELVPDEEIQQAE